MNRRQFLTVLGSASAVSMMNVRAAFAEETTSLYVKGLVIFDFENPDVLRIGFPKAPGHKATLAIADKTGSKRTLTIKGHGVVDATGVALAGEPKIQVPELVRMREFYGASVKSKVDQCPSVISVPSSAILSVTTSELSKARYTFERADTGQELVTFRPRQVAEAIRIELSSAGTLKLDNGKLSIPLQTARELRVEYIPESVNGMDAYADHFHHYFSYVERPAALDFDVVPRKVGGNSAPAPKVGNQFMMVDLWPFCFAIAVP
jgi:hypothetical protein